MGTAIDTAARCNVKNGMQQRRRSKTAFLGQPACFCCLRCSCMLAYSPAHLLAVAVFCLCWIHVGSQVENLAACSVNSTNPHTTKLVGGIARGTFGKSRRLFTPSTQKKLF